MCELCKQVGVIGGGTNGAKEIRVRLDFSPPLYRPCPPSGLDSLEEGSRREGVSNANELPLENVVEARDRPAAADHGPA